MAVVCTMVGMVWNTGSRAGLALFLLGCEEPKVRPTPEAPTTVAVAQSCITRVRQSWRLVRLGREVYRGETQTGKVQPLSEDEVAEASRHIKTKQGPLQSVQAINASAGHEIEKRRVVTVGTVFILVNNQAAGESSLVEALVTTSRALWHVREPRIASCTRRDSGGMEGKACCTSGRCRGRAARLSTRTSTSTSTSTATG
jgi:hypothetical protein